ncbi:MAG: hypothetical protein ACE5KF_12125, partial [Kiloniellaceae bacterium]
MRLDRRRRPGPSARQEPEHAKADGKENQVHEVHLAHDCPAATLNPPRSITATSPFSPTAWRGTDTMRMPSILMETVFTLSSSVNPCSSEQELERRDEPHIRRALVKEKQGGEE